MPPLFEIDGKVALVTGASGGLGQQFARTLAEADAKVALAARSKDKLAANVAEITAAGGTLAVQMDVTDGESVERGLATIVDAFGGVATIIINNSGIASHQSALELRAPEWDKVFDTNVKGAWLAAAAAHRMIAARAPGSVINIASILAG